MLLSALLVNTSKTKVALPFGVSEACTVARLLPRDESVCCNFWIALVVFRDCRACPAALAVGKGESSFVSSELTFRSCYPACVRLTLIASFRRLFGLVGCSGDSGASGPSVRGTRLTLVSPKSSFRACFFYIGYIINAKFVLAHYNKFVRILVASLAL